MGVHFGPKLFIRHLTPQKNQFLKVKVRQFPAVQLHKSCILNRNHWGCKYNGEVSFSENEGFPILVDLKFLVEIILYFRSRCG